MSYIRTICSAIFILAFNFFLGCANEAEFAGDNKEALENQEATLPKSDNVEGVAAPEAPKPEPSAELPPEPEPREEVAEEPLEEPLQTKTLDTEGEPLVVIAPDPTYDELEEIKSYSVPNDFTTMPAEDSVPETEPTPESTKNDLAKSGMEDTSIPLPELTELVGKSLELSFLDETLQGKIEISEGVVSFTPPENYYGQQVLTYYAKNNSFVDTYGLLTLTVDPVNDIPTADDETVVAYEDSVLENKALTSGKDVETAELEYSIVSVPDATRGVFELLDPKTGAYKYTPAPNVNGNEVVTFQVSDGELKSELATLNIQVTALPDTPIVTGKDFQTNEDIPISGSFDMPINPDGTPGLLFEKLTDPAHGILDLRPNGTFTYTPMANNYQDIEFTFHVRSGMITSNIATAKILIAPVNDAPTARPENLAIYKNVDLPILLYGNDIENDALTYAVSNPTNGTLVDFDPNTGSVIYRPDLNYYGNDSFTYYVTDAGGAVSSTKTISITVNNVETIITDSFERDALFDASNPKSGAFAWTAIIDEDGQPMNEQVACNNQHICAAIYDKDVYGLGPMADGNKSLIFTGRRGSSIHDLWLLAKTFDLSAYPSAELDFKWLGFDLHDSDPSSGGKLPDSEHLKVELCVDTVANCRGNMTNESYWIPFFNSRNEGDENNGLNGRNHNSPDRWKGKTVLFDFTAIKAMYPNFSETTFTFRFEARMQDGFEGNDPFQPISDAAAVDKVTLKAK